MTHTAALPALAPGDVVHVRKAVNWVTFANAETLIVFADTLERGQVVVLTEQNIADNSVVLATIDEKSGFLGRGRWPESETLWESPADPLYAIERERRRAEAMRLPSETQQQEALRRINKEMPMTPTQVSRELYGGRHHGHADDPNTRLV